MTALAGSSRHAAERLKLLISPSEINLFWATFPDVIVHVGAHEAEERSAYRSAGWGKKKLVWIEALPDKAHELSRRLDGSLSETAIQALAWNATGEELVFFRTDNAQSSSALEMKEHKIEYPNVQVTEEIHLVTSALDDLAEIRNLGDIGLVNIDVQGAELRVLQGMQATLKRTQVVYCEYNTRELYEECAQLVELDEFLKLRGFVRVDWQDTGRGWGDALWLREEVVPSLVVARRLVRRASTRLRLLKRKCLKLGRLICPV